MTMRDCIYHKISTYPGLPRSGKNVWKMKFYPGQGKKSGNFVDDQGNLERTWKVREKSGNLKINGYGSLQTIYSVQKGDGYTFSWDSLSLSSSSLVGGRGGGYF